MRRHAVTGPVIVSLLAFAAVLLLVGGCGTTEMRPSSSVAPAATDATLYHDGRFAGLRDVVDHYNGHFRLGLTAAETQDLIEHLKAL